MAAMLPYVAYENGKRSMLRISYIEEVAWEKAVMSR